MKKSYRDFSNSTTIVELLQLPSIIQFYT